MRSQDMHASRVEQFELMNVLGTNLAIHSDGRIQYNIGTVVSGVSASVYFANRKFSARPAKSFHGPSAKRCSRRRLRSARSAAGSRTPEN